jgi:cytochrome c
MAGVDSQGDMNDELRWNKVFGALLGALLLVFGLRQAAEMIYATSAPKVAGDKIAIQETASDAGEVAYTPPDWGTVLPTASVSNGATISNKCKACHNFDNGGPNQTGPNLWGVIGRKPGTHPGFAYSSAMVAFGNKIGVWDYQHVYEFIHGPQAYLDGTKMSFVGLKERQDRIDLISWLRQQSSSPVPIPPPNPKAAAAAKAPANAPSGTSPTPATGSGVPSTKAETAGAPAPTNAPAPLSGQAEKSSSQGPISGAAAPPQSLRSAPTGGPPQ